MSDTLAAVLTASSAIVLLVGFVLVTRSYKWPPAPPAELSLSIKAVDNMTDQLRTLGQAVQLTGVAFRLGALRLNNFGDALRQAAAHEQYIHEMTALGWKRWEAQEAYKAVQWVYPVLGQVETYHTIRVLAARGTLADLLDIYWTETGGGL